MQSALQVGQLQMWLRLWSLAGVAVSLEHSAERVMHACCSWGLLVMTNTSDGPVKLSPLAAVAPG